MSESSQITGNFWSVKQVSDALHVHSRTVLNWVNAGRLPAIKVGRVIRISDADLQTFLKMVRTEARKKRHGEPTPTGDHLAKLSIDREVTA